MATLTIRKTWKVNGAFTNPTSMTLGIVRDDTSAVVLASGTAMTAVSTGIYEYTLTSAVSETTYTATITVVYNGQTYIEQVNATADTTLTATDWQYATRGDIEDVFGLPNVIKWSLLSGADPTSSAGLLEVSGRIERALGWASDQINNALREGGYDPVPITADGAQNTLAILAATIAGVWLYENRGVPEFNSVTGQPEHRYAWKKKECDKMLESIAARKIRLDAPHPEKWSNSPFAQRTPRVTPAQPVGNYGFGHGTGGGLSLQ